ncbi:MAG: MlaD family protein [Candidatus Omnitrophota bacterium]|jgi:phospholipid/cholesterol/gamma-HCH transport system substrate-binding protein
MFTRVNFELKVGIFIFIGMVILSVIIFSIGNFYSVKRGYNIDVVFSFANGIGVGAPVRYSGVEVGEVQEIKVYFDEKENKPLVKLTIWVSQNTWINENAKASINTLGLLGEKYLEISPGTRDTRLLQKGETLRGQDPVSTEEIARSTKELIEKISTLTESVNDIAGDDSLRTSLKNTVSNMEALSGDLRDFLSYAKQGKGTIGRLMSDDTLYNHIDELILDIKQNPWKLLFKPPEAKRSKKK